MHWLLGRLRTILLTRVRGEEVDVEESLYSKRRSVSVMSANRSRHLVLGHKYGPKEDGV